MATHPQPDDATAARQSRKRSLSNLLRMGHCAPAVMRTLLDLDGVEEDWPVKLVAGLPGGIGNTGGECGGVTAPLVMLGLRHGRSALPELLDEGHALCERFTACHGTLLCREIRGDRRLPLPCIAVVRRAPELCREASRAEAGATPLAQRRLLAHLSKQGFHCAHAVLEPLGDLVPVTPKLLDATAAFVGGTLLEGMTCSAFTAGVMAVGLAIGEVEDSRARVMGMIARMIVGAGAFRDDVNAFNRIMNLGHRMSRWFAGRFGSTQCRAITGCDLASGEGVSRYVDVDGVARCRRIAAEVAARARAVVVEARHGQ